VYDSGVANESALGAGSGSNKKNLAGRGCRTGQCTCRKRAKKSRWNKFTARKKASSAESVG
jgi:hypothetical protein